MKKLFASRSRKLLLIILVLLIAVGAGAYINNQNDKKTAKASDPKYLNFAGNYVFSVPKNYTVDEQTVPGAQLVYFGQITVKTLDDVYNAGGISVYGISDLTDHSSQAFKTYVNDKYLPELKKNLSASDVQMKFDIQNGQDVARVDIKKDGQVFRSVYLKGGQHPAAVIAKQETSAYKDIAQTLTDVENSDIKKETQPIRQSVKITAQLVKDQKAQELYDSAADELRTKNSQDELTKALQTAAPYTAGNITISGVSYTSTEFSAAMRFTKLNQDDQEPVFGLLNYKKIGGQWKLTLLSLPTPKQ